MRKPKRALGQQVGRLRHRLHAAADARPRGRRRGSPGRACPTARMPEAQTLLIVSEETSFGMPALICAWREGIWPWPAWSTWPITTCSTCSGSTSARSSAALMAMPPSSVAVERREAAAQLADRACGRRRGSRSWACGRVDVASRAACDVTRHHRRPARHRRRHDRRRRLRGRGRSRTTSTAARCRRCVDSGEAKRRPAQARASRTPTGERWIVAGLGERDEFDAERARVAAAAVARPRARARHARRCAGRCPHHVADAHAGGARRGHAARRLPLRRATRASADDDARARASCSSPPTTTSPRPVARGRGRRRGGQRARATSRTRPPTT